MQPPGYPPTASSYPAPSFTPLQNYTITPQYTPPEAPIYQNPPLAVPQSSAPVYTQPQAQAATIAATAVPEAADGIDEDMLWSYTDYLTSHIDNNSSYTALNDAIEKLKELIENACDNDDQKTHLYYSKIIEQLYLKNVQPSRELCTFMLSTGNHEQISVDHFIKYIQQETQKAKNDKDPDEQMEHINAKILFFSDHLKNTTDIIKLANLTPDSNVRDEIINNFIFKDQAILQDPSSEKLINLITKDNVDRKDWIQKRIMVDPQSIKTYINDLKGLEYIDKNFGEFLATVGLSHFKDNSDISNNLTNILTQHNVS